LEAAETLMTVDNTQLELFPPGKDDLSDVASRYDPACWAITPGDWLSIEHEGKTVVGMIYRRRGPAYQFVYWDNMVLRFGTTTRDCIGAWDQGLTAVFRGQIAIIPNYVERCLATWVMQSSQPVRPKRKAAGSRSIKGERPMVQKRLFPE
jgi:hypothetical protein